jgi:hypothetical protein
MVVADTELQGIIHVLFGFTSRVAQRKGSIRQHVARTSSTCKSNSGGVSHLGPALDDTETAATTRGEHKTAAARTSEAHDWQRGAPVGEIPSGAAHLHVCTCIRTSMYHPKLACSLAWHDTDDGSTGQIHPTAWTQVVGHDGQKDGGEGERICLY